MLDQDAFVAEAPVEREVTYGGQTHKLFFREVADADWHRYIAFRSADDVDVRASARGFLISKSLCEPDGKPSISKEKASTLKLRVAKAIESTILELEKSTKEDVGNASEPGAETGSGTS